MSEQWTEETRKRLEQWLSEGGDGRQVWRDTLNPMLAELTRLREELVKELRSRKVWEAVAESNYTEVERLREENERLRDKLDTATLAAKVASQEAGRLEILVKASGVDPAMPIPPFPAQIWRERAEAAEAKLAEAQGELHKTDALMRTYKAELAAAREAAALVMGGLRRARERVRVLREAQSRAFAILTRTNPSGWRVDPQGMIDEAIAALRSSEEKYAEVADEMVTAWKWDQKQKEKK